jgi:subtilisin family serine protease
MLNIDGKYMYPTIADGTGVTVYVIDTGILTTHNEFNTGGVVRAKWGFNAVDKIDTDEHGHGTHCAGTIAGTTYGMAKGARLVAVKVLNKQGSGSTAGVIQGIDWTSSAAKSDASASVASMSLGGGKSTAMNSAIDAASGDPTQVVIFSVAAGNDNKDAINVSPASASLAICVAASDNTDKKATFSNWGRTVALYGPGVSITSSWIGSNTATNTISGTSMACPHVSGQIAKFMQLQPRAQPAEVKGFLSSVATDGIITGGATGGTPNKLLFADCDTFAGLANSTLLQKRY